MADPPRPGAASGVLGPPVRRRDPAGHRRRVRELQQRDPHATYPAGEDRGTGRPGAAPAWPAASATESSRTGCASTPRSKRNRPGADMLARSLRWRGGGQPPHDAGNGRKRGRCVAERRRCWSRRPAAGRRWRGCARWSRSQSRSPAGGCPRDGSGEAGAEVATRSGRRSPRAVTRRGGTGTEPAHRRRWSRIPLFCDPTQKSCLRHASIPGHVHGRTSRCPTDVPDTPSGQGSNSPCVVTRPASDGPVTPGRRWY